MDSPTTTHHDDRPVRRRRWPLWLGALVLILTALAWLTYQQRVMLFTNTVNSTLLPYGLQVEALAGLRLGAASLQIRELALIHSESGLSQTLDNIDISFTVSGLVNGRVDSIAIASANINIPDSLTAATASPDVIAALPAAINAKPPTPVTGALPADIMSAIPFNRMRIAQLDITGHEITLGAAHIHQLSAGLSTVQVSCQPSRCRLTTELDLTINRLDVSSDSADLELDLITFHTDAPIDATFEANTNTLTLAASSSTLRLPAIRAGETLTGMTGAFHRISVSLPLTDTGTDLTDLYAHAEMSVSELYTNLVDINLWSMRLDQHLTWQQDTMHAAGALMLGNQRLLLNDLQHSVYAGTGQGTLDVPRTEFNDNNRKLSDLLTPLPWQADILAGALNAHARLSWRADEHSLPAVSGVVGISLDDISGYIGEIAFLRLNTDFAAELLPNWHLRSSRAASVSMASLDPGIELTNISSDVLLDSQAGSVTLSNASLNVFGGTVSSDQLHYQLENNDSQFTLRIDRIDLEKVLSMSAYEGVSATGMVSGQLPVRLQGLNPSISGGTLTALQPGGTIRYSAGMDAAGNPSSSGNQSLDMVYQALEHYRFNLMETTVDYQPDGELDLAIRMEGISTELNGGQRINLNLTINDDVPALLQSLQAARSVTDSIQARLDARQADSGQDSPEQ